MNNTERHCDTCNDSYYMTEKNPSGGKELVRLQHCRNTVYNSPAYTHQMLLEDWARASAAFGPLSQRKEMNMNNNYTIAQRNALVEKYLWCIDTVIRKNRPLMRAARLEYDDVYQQLALRLIKAVAGFDSQKGTLQQHIFAQLKYELLNCKSAYRLCGLTGAPKEYRKSDMVSLENIPEGSPLYEQVMAA